MKAVIKKCLSSMGYEIYRRPPAGEARDLVADLCRSLSIERIPALPMAQYEQECPPLADAAIPVRSDVPLRHYRSLEEALTNDSVKQYFEVRPGAGGYTITDRYPKSHFFSRQRMLHAVYRRMFGSGLGGASVLDVGCSSGYYSFYCARAGAAPVLGIDARPDHEDQFDVLHRTLAMPDTCRYRHVDMEREMESVAQAFDLVLAQGVLYHTYDHPRFVQNLHRVTRRVLVLEGHCSGDEGLLCRAMLEPQSCLRSSIHGPVIYPSARWMVDLLRWAGFKQVFYVDLPPEVSDAWGYGQLKRCMLAGVKG